MSRSDSRRLAIGVLTYKRVEQITSLVPLLVAQAERLARDKGWLVDVIVVDNDPSGSARAAIEALGSALVTYAVEPKPGIASARNEVLRQADMLGADILVFIDDDEVPSEDWLSLLVATYLSTGAAAVSGPVLYVPEAPTDAWFHAWQHLVYGERDARATGQTVRSAGTGNLLIDLSVVRAMNLTFDPDYGISGGEDSLFTSALSRAGHTIAWNAEATASELVPATRLQRTYMIRRMAVRANVSARMTYRRGTAADRLRAHGKHLIGGLARVTVGSCLSLGARIVGSPKSLARGQFLAAIGRGWVAAVFGRTMLQYTRPDSAKSA